MGEGRVEECEVGDSGDAHNCWTYSGNIVKS
jgi:hypothetical protein